MPLANRASTIVARLGMALTATPLTACLSQLTVLAIESLPSLPVAPVHTDVGA